MTSSTPVFHLLQNHEIDFGRWDAALEQSDNGRVYALSWYLNEMAPGWKALVTPDYRLIMPLPVRQKWGIEYVFQPAFTQQLGLFSAEKTELHWMSHCLNLVGKAFRYVEINANSGNMPEQPAGLIRKNYLLPLGEPYEVLRKQYSRSARRNIEKAHRSGIMATGSDEAATLVALHRERYGTRLATAEDYLAFSRVLQTALQKNRARIFHAHTAAGTTVASSGYLLFRDRLVFVINGNTADSLQNGASHLLKDYVIRQFAGTGRIMDFEGSDHADFARFYEQYGAMATDNYPFYRMNRLPRLLRWLKR